MWTYDQKTGWLYEQGKKYAQCYSGHGEGRNNPDMQNVKNVGPIPVGLYTISQAFTHPRLGPLVMRLEPAPTNEMFGRNDFYLHGDNSKENYTASDGCIVAQRIARAYINASVDRHVTVVREVSGDSPPIKEHIVV